MFPPSNVRELIEMRVPATADTRELVFTARDVLSRLPAPRSRSVAAACDTLAAACEVVDQALAHNHRVRVEEELISGSSRVELIGSLSPILMILEALALAKVPALADEGRRLKTELFGADFQIKTLSARTLFSVVKGVDRQLASDPDVSQRLFARVPQALWTHVQAVHARLGEELGVDGWKIEARIPMRALRKMMRDRLGQLMQVLAATAVLDPQQEAEVRQQLRPVAALAESVRPRRRAKKAVAPAPDQPLTAGSTSSTRPAPASGPSTPGGGQTSSPAASPSRSPSADRPG